MGGVEGATVGARDGLLEVEGASDGAPDGRGDGIPEGANEGMPEGCNVGTREVLGAADKEGWSDWACDWVGDTEGMKVEGDDDTTSSDVVETAAVTLLLLAFFVCGAYTTSVMIRARATRARATNANRILTVVERRR